VEGYFKLTILNNLDVFVAELTSTSPQIVLTNAYRDGLSLDALPNWKLVVEHINGSLISDPSTITLVPA
jgi:hypothetical protein